MTDEEREKLCTQLRYMYNEWYCDHCDLEPCETAADEIERLEAENDWLRTALRAAQIGAGLAPTGPDDKSGDCNANPGQ
jgi:hypothetical protein